MPATEVGRRDIEAFDLAWLDAGADLAERVLIGWGPGTRAWSQWAGRGAKPILAWRQTAQDPPFPGFAAFRARITDLPTFPQAWLGALEAVRGVYLLVSDTGEQYVGPASGAEGFAGRWRAYLANGHGGNLLLRQRGLRDYTVSILEIASPDMAPAEILARESAWKEKLGARAHGLNAN
ncbi:GIY-YIG nuclease family protein [Frigidibacter sp. MR17.14]|uniref:GIY-YIG nuclease family protein n=1 Tax=Frigidibacter sp. MR17.14 TaxID=3126509 RepID=UPI003012C438